MVLWKDFRINSSSTKVIIFHFGGDSHRKVTRAGSQKPRALRFLWIKGPVVRLIPLVSLLSEVLFLWFTSILEKRWLVGSLPGLPALFQRRLRLNFCAERSSARSPDEWKVVQRHLCLEANCWLQHFAVVPDTSCTDSGSTFPLQWKSHSSSSCWRHNDCDKRAESDWNPFVLCNVLYLMFRLWIGI